jgi:hypothetical protein
MKKSDLRGYEAVALALYLSGGTDVPFDQMAIKAYYLCPSVLSWLEKYKPMPHPDKIRRALRSAKDKGLAKAEGGNRWTLTKAGAQVAERLKTKNLHDLSNVSSIRVSETIALILRELGGTTKRVNTERLAMLAAEIDPDRFAFILPEYRGLHIPDMERVGKALRHAKEAQYGNLVTGSTNRDPVKDGWKLTANGVKRTRELLKISGNGQHKQKISNETRLALQRLKSHSTWKFYTRSNRVDKLGPYDFADFLEAMTDTPKDILSMKFNEVYRIALDAEDEKLLHFLDDCVIKFVDMLDTSLLEIEHG